MEVKIKSIFLDELLIKIPVFYRFMSEFETTELGELKVGARFSKSEKHFSENYLQFDLHKPTGDKDLSEFFKE